MLKEIGVEYVIIGHSERRQYFNETDETVNSRLKAALKYELKPIVCVGELLEEREKGITNEVLEKQTVHALKDISADDVSNLVIAYEPVWAIGTGKTASSDDANDACKFVRGVIEKLYNKEVAESVRIQYGGSVKPSNANELFTTSDIDGGLVGGASLKVDDFTAIVKY
jgi:triosephosphate isomerase